MKQSVDVSCILYCNDPIEVESIVEAASNAARVARDAKILGDWSFRFGDGSPKAVLSDELLAKFRSYVTQQGGEFSYDFFGINLGTAAGHNRLVKQGKADQLIILNPGLVEPKLMLEMLRTTADDIGFIEARQVPIDHPKDYDPVTGDTGWGSTACAMIPRKLFQELGGFDSDTFFMYCDDVDFSWRVRLAGKRVVHQPAARMFHDKRLTSDAAWIPTDAERYYSAEAGLLLPYKYSRGDILEEVISWFRNSGDPILKKALKAFESARKAGKLPKEIDKDRRVAEFLNGNYTKNRY